MSQPTPSPATPRIATLPIGTLGYERFEQFAHDLLVALPGMRPDTAHRYGTQGQKQRGIDLTVQTESGELWAFSNKRYKHYQPHHVPEHITETTYVADRYFILISGIASPDVRDEIRKFPKWELWDSEDLSQKVRLELNPEAARRIVDHHFGPVYRRDFLGLPAVGAFLSLEDFFRPLLDSSRLFHHNLPLVGRQALLDELLAFGGDGRERVLVLPGRGGIGKSRLLRELAERLDSAHPLRAVRLLNEGVPISLEALDDLPSVPCVVAVDDAHRRMDLGPLLAWLRQRTDARLLLFTRPQGVDFLLSELTRSDFDTFQVRRLPAVEQMPKAEVRQLAAQVLGPDNEHLVNLLTRVTRDCPLVTVVGGRLLAMRSVHPELLERDEDFRQAVLNRFRDESLGRVSDQVPQDLARRLLEVVTALSPVPADAGLFHDRIAAFLNVDPVEITRALGELERVALLLRRGQTVRVVPDVLADHVLASACLTQGRATGFADAVFAAFAGDCLAQLLRNLAELDWRVRVTTGDDSPLLDRVWRQVENEFHSGGHWGRADLLKKLRDSAYFLPTRVLDLVSFAVRNPALGGPEEVVAGYLSYTHEDVVRAAPEVLHRCAYAPDCLPACLDLLWELDKGDDRDTNSHTEHPFRVLTEIADWRPDKPLWVNRDVVAAGRRWLTRSDAWDRRHTPLDVLDRLLEKSGVEQEASSRSFRMRPFHLDYKSVRDLRNDVLDTIDGCLRSQDLRAVLRAIASLGAGLSGPAPYFGMVLTADELQQWEPEQLRIMGMLGELIQGNPRPLVSLAVLRVVRHHARHGRHPSVRERGSALVGSIEQTFDLRLTRLLLPEMSSWDLFEEDAGPDPVAGHEQRFTSLARTVAIEYWKRYPDPEAAAGEVDRRVRDILRVEPKCDAFALIWWLFETRPDAVLPFSRQMLRMPASPLAPCLKAALVHLNRTDRGAAIDFAAQALDTEVRAFRYSVAYHFAWDLPRGVPLHERELECIRRLLTDSDVHIRATAVGALRRVAAWQPRVALDLARAVDTNAGPGIVIELCRLADRDWSGCPEAFTTEDINAFLEKIEGLDGVGYEIARFLTFACERNARGVLEMLIRRIERQERDGWQSGYTPIPFKALHGSFTVIGGLDEQRELLCRIRDYSLGKDGVTLHSLADLYRDVSQGYAPVGVAVLADWMLNGNHEQMEAAAALLERAPNRFVFDHLDLMSQTLDRAQQIGEECLRTVASSFYKIATGGMRSGAAGEPFPQDVELRQRCQDALQGLIAGGPAFRLVRDVLTRTERDIKRAMQEEDEED